MAYIIVPTESHPAHQPNVEIKDLVQVMADDLVLIRGWSQLSDTLGLPNQYKARWQQGIRTSTLQYYELFSEMLQTWTSISLMTTQSAKTIQDLCRVLRDMNCNAVAERLEGRFGKHSLIATRPHTVIEINKRDAFNETEYAAYVPVVINEYGMSQPSATVKQETQWPITHGLKEPIKNLSGRSEELKTIKSCFYNSKKDNIILICGLGGIGKTELCRKFASSIISGYKKFGTNIRRNNTVISRVWLNGENFESLRNSVLELARDLGFTSTTEPPSQYFQRIATRILQNCDRLLVIIDNIDIKYDEFFKLVQTVKLSEYSGKFFVVATSRDRLVLDSAGTTLLLDVLSRNQARYMLQSSIDSVTDSEADQVCNLVQNFPLALQQAIAYIKQQRNFPMTLNYSVINYVEEFENKKAEMLGLKLNEIDFNYSMTTLIAWNMTIEKMSLCAVEILNIMAHLEPDGIDILFLKAIYKRSDFDEGLNSLFRYSLVKKEDDIVSIHRLVQEIIRSKMKNPEEYCKALFKSTLASCAEFSRHSNRRRSEIAHLITISKFAWENKIYFGHEALLLVLERDGLSTNVPYIEPHILPCNLCIGANILNETDSIGREWLVNITVSLFVRDCLPLEAGLKISEKYFGEISNITFAVKNRLVKRLWDFGEISKSIQLFEELIPFPCMDCQKQDYLKTMEHIVETIDEKVEEEILEGVSKIVAQLGDILLNDQLKGIEMKLELIQKSHSLKKASKSAVLRYMCWLAAVYGIVCFILFILSIVSQSWILNSYLLVLNICGLIYWVLWVNNLLYKLDTDTRFKFKILLYVCLNLFMIIFYLMIILLLIQHNNRNENQPVWGTL